MMNLILLAAFITYCLHLGNCYKLGPPVSEYPEICYDMIPIGHEATAKTSKAPFDISVSTTCATTDQPITVVLSSTNNKTHFEGFFVQARLINEGNQTYGVFGTNNDKQLQGLQCNNSPNPHSNNSLGHSQAKKYYKKTFTWTPPASGLNGRIHFVATVVHETPDFWLNVTSPIVYVGGTFCPSSGSIPRAEIFITGAFFAALSVLNVY